MNKKIDRSKNIIVLLLDTVRASDAYNSKFMPFLNNLSKHATKYDKAVAPGTWTATSHAALFVDKPVSRISNVSQNFFKKNTKIEPWFVKTKFLRNNEETLAKKLQRYGYYSVLFTNNPFLTSFTNLALGFNKVYDLWLYSNVKYNKKLADRVSFVLKGGIKTRERIFTVVNSIGKIIPKPLFDRLYLNLRVKLNKSVAKADGTYMLDRGANDTISKLKNYFEYNYNYMPNFIFINYMEAHENYPVKNKDFPQDKWLYMSGIEELNEYTLSKLHNAYIKRLHYLDKKVAETINVIKKQGLLDNAIVIVTSDHGQFFGEHKMLYHSLFPYKEEVEVPLIAVAFENSKLVRTNKFVNKPTNLLSLHKTIINIAAGNKKQPDSNIEKNNYVISEHTGISEGWDYSLLSMLKNHSETVMKIYKAKIKYNIKVSTIYGVKENLKLIHFFKKKKDELYSLDDTREENNIIDAYRSKAHKLLHRLPVVKTI